MTRTPLSNANGSDPPPVPRMPRPWWIYRGTGLPLHDVAVEDLLPKAPPWRTFAGRAAGPDGSGTPDATEPPAPPEDDAELVRRLGGSIGGATPDAAEADLVNAAIILRRPLLVTGRPGTGKSTLAYRISRELGLGRVLRWPVTSHSTLRAALYHYDAVGRVHAAAAGEGRDGGTGIGDFLQLGPLGTALLPGRLPRVLLIDEFDKSDMDLPNDLLDVFEAGEFTVPELVRMRRTQPVVEVQSDDPERSTFIAGGRVQCRSFPVVIITSNGEREFPPAFLRRCLQLTMRDPDVDRMAEIVAFHLGAAAEDPETQELIRAFVEQSEREGGLAADQLLNSIYLATSGANQSAKSWDSLLKAVWRRLDGTGAT
jgi:MoxR-like ATPase